VCDGFYFLCTSNDIWAISQLDDTSNISACALKVRVSLRNIPLLPSILGLKTLTELTLLNYNFYPRPDVLLDPSEENHLLESATPGIGSPGA